MKPRVESAILSEKLWALIKDEDPGIAIVALADATAHLVARHQVPGQPKTTARVQNGVIELHHSALYSLMERNNMLVHEEQLALAKAGGEPDAAPAS